MSGAAGAEPRGKKAAQLEAIGTARAPAYVRSNELANVESATFRRAPGHQWARAGGKRTIRLDPAKKVYLWVIDQSGAFHVAPYEKLPDGGENIGHPMLVGGRGARMAGELHFVRRKKSGKDVWDLDSDSGRYVKPYPEVSADQLEAARQLLKRVAIVSASPGKRARPVKLSAHFVEPGSSRANMRRVFSRARRVGGYVLLPPKGSTNHALPARLRSKTARARWQRAARARHAPAR